MADNHISKSMSGPQDVECRDCARVLATITLTGLVPVEPRAQACETCREFRTFYEAWRIAHREFEVLRSKRQDHKGRQMAREAASRARIMFENLLLRVEARTTQVRKNEEEKEQKGEKERQLNLKTSRSTSYLSSRKRLKFLDSIEDQDYRNYLEYNRHDDTYVPGRYAPPDGTEYLDTSGHSQTFSKFSRTRRVGSQWIDLEEENDARHDDLGDDKMKNNASKEREDSVTIIEGQMTRELANAEPNEQLLRLVKRRKILPSLEAQQTLNKVGSSGQNGNTYNAFENAHNASRVHNSKEQLPDIGSAEVTSPFSGTVAEENGILHVSNKRCQPMPVNSSIAADDRVAKRKKVWIHGIHESPTLREDGTSEGSAERDLCGSGSSRNIEENEILTITKNTALRTPAGDTTKADECVDKNSRIFRIRATNEIK